MSTPRGYVLIKQPGHHLADVRGCHHSVEHRRRDLGWRMPDEPNPSVQCACGCGGSLERFDRWRRPRSYITGHNMRDGSRHG